MNNPSPHPPPPAPRTVPATQARVAAPPRGAGRCAGWALLLLGLASAEPAAAAGLRLRASAPPDTGALQLLVVPEDGTALTAARASWIAVLRAASLTPSPAHWSDAEGPRSLAAGGLRVEDTPAPGGPAAGFYVARESSPPPAVTVSNAAGLSAAVAAAKPGTRILLAPGTYPGGFFFSRVRGQNGLPIVLAGADPQHPPVIAGGPNGMQFSDPEWLELQDLVFTGATGNGLNIDDGGSFDTPARHIGLRNLRIADVGPEGNRDGIKLSGVVGFAVEGCTIERWGSGGSAVDMVGCHQGLIQSNLFRHTAAAASTGANGVQTKGGSRAVVIRRNRFEHTGARGVNLGGSTGLEFFRPPLQAGAEHGEARDIHVEGNTFVGSTAPIAFVGADAAVVRFNTIYRPDRWAIRILQETTADGFVPCRNGLFTDNIVAFHSSQWSGGGVNVGPDTAPTTFRFARNWWYCLDDPARSQPALPVAETSGTLGLSPEFRDAANGDLRLQPGSPARGVGAEALPE